VTKPFSQACENNKRPILAVLERYLQGRSVRLLEIGSGTGQHAAYFCPQLPGVRWHSTDLPEAHAGIEAWRLDTNASNFMPPRALDVRAEDWALADDEAVDAVFTANTLHIMSWPAARAFFAGVGRVLAPGGLLLVYGPFNYAGALTSQSNERFDAWLRSRDAESGIRSFEDANAEAICAGLELVEDCEMPANNRMLVWRAA